jgi:hypothetical protein
MSHYDRDGRRLTRGQSKPIRRIKANEGTRRRWQEESSTNPDEARRATAIKETTFDETNPRRSRKCLQGQYLNSFPCSTPGRSDDAERRGRHSNAERRNEDGRGRSRRATLTKQSHAGRHGSAPRGGDETIVLRETKPRGPSPLVYSLCKIGSMPRRTKPVEIIPGRMDGK